MLLFLSVTLELVELEKDQIKQVKKKKNIEIEKLEERPLTVTT